MKVHIDIFAVSLVCFFKNINKSVKPNLFQQKSTHYRQPKQKMNCSFNRYTKEGVRWFEFCAM